MFCTRWRTSGSSNLEKQCTTSYLQYECAYTHSKANIPFKQPNPPPPEKHFPAITAQPTDKNGSNLIMIASLSDILGIKVEHDDPISIPLACRVIIGIKLRYLCRNKLPRIIFILMCGSDYVISHIVNGARSSALIDGKVS